jgi:DNA-damage-inducible protein D
MEHNKIVLFQEKNIRRVWHEEQWFFSIIDVVGILSESADPQRYWSVLKSRLKKQEGFDVTTICSKLKMVGLDGKNYPTDCANTEGLLRLIMSIPSPKAEPFKLWLAQVGQERIQEIENPEIGIQRIRELYQAKGYTDEWIEGRLKSINIRKQLTDEWKKRGVKEGQEYAILTAEIAKATFGLTPSEHKNLKGLEKQNLRDHMTNLELIFTMLGEEVTRTYTVEDNAQGFIESQNAAQKGGVAAGEARKRLEKVTGKPVVSANNYLNGFIEEDKPLINEK